MNAENIKRLFADLAETLELNKVYLGDLDAALGDGDHGVGMARGFAKAHEAVETLAGEDLGQLLQAGARALMAGVGGASGPLFAMMFLELGRASAGKTDLQMDAFKEGIKNAVIAIVRVGKAVVGDKTMLDVLVPVSEALQVETELETALGRAALVARAAAEKTADLVARRGRAQHVAGAGLGQLDPGAVSLALIFETFAKFGQSST